jgi:SAM-dependent methyltransferase
VEGLPEPRLYADPERHLAAAAAIRRRSTNPVDVLSFALDGQDLAGVRDLLDLGCGPGRASAAAAARCHPSCRVVGLDACAANGPHFLASIARTGRPAGFRALTLDDAIPFPAEAFDLVLATWSIYYFVGLIPEIARVLRPGGRLLAITHRADMLTDLLQAGGLDPARAPQAEILPRFCAGNAADLLRPHLADISRRDYPNALEFGPDDLDDLETYLDFRAPLLLPADAPPDALDALLARLAAEIRARGTLRVAKDDVVFTAWKAPCP